MIELTLVMTKSISKKDFEKFMKGDLKIQFSKEVVWDDDRVAADPGNFNGVVLDLGGGGEMLFVGNDHPRVDKLLEDEAFVGVDIHFPELS